MKILPLLALLAACDPQVDAEHQGTPLAQLTGTIRNTRTLPTGDPEVLVVWIGDSPAGDTSDIDSVAVTGTFPAQFSLSIYEPPGPAFLLELPGGSFGVGTIFASTLGTDYTDEESVDRGLLGMAADHLLVYVPEDIRAGSLASYMLRGLPKAGFHLYGVHKLTDAEDTARQECRASLEVDGEEAPYAEVFESCGGYSFDDFVPLESDLDTPIEIDLVDDPSQIDTPNWG